MNRKMNDQILTLEETAIYLKIPKTTLYKLAQEQKLPASKIGKHWRFLKNDIINWMRNQSRQLKS
ncbi:MAG: helix-turn-helix domain-containing protein [Thermodesulfobacteriota bacterium]|nr:helix-turn-helix domain-containing protein [Thermodesulfobacteriota bacterium]